MACLTKCRSSEDYHEGCAVAGMGVIANPESHLDTYIVHRGKLDKDWAKFDSIITPRWDDIGYYYNEQP